MEDGTYGKSLMPGGPTDPQGPFPTDAGYWPGKVFWRGTRAAREAGLADEAPGPTFDQLEGTLDTMGSFGHGNPKTGIGDAPTRATTLPDGAAARKKYPVASGVLDYFPDALVAIAEVSYRGNEQHNPGQPLHWAREKSTDQDDTIIRHFLQRGTYDTDGVRHSAKMAWRVLALLQIEIEEEQRAKDNA